MAVSALGWENQIDRQDLEPTQRYLVELMKPMLYPTPSTGSLDVYPIWVWLGRGRGGVGGKNVYVCILKEKQLGKSFIPLNLFSFRIHTFTFCHRQPHLTQLNRYKKNMTKFNSLN